MMLCEMLGTSIEEINLCINVRNRRQRVLKNISFESEDFNIYDPEFTSEEELDSVIQHDVVNNVDKKKKKYADDVEEDSWYNDTENEDNDEEVEVADANSFEQEDGGQIDTVYFKENVEDEDMTIEEKDYSFALQVSNVVKTSKKQKSKEKLLISDEGHQDEDQ